MNLAIDIGNTQTKIGLFEENELKEVFLKEDALSEILAAHLVQYAILSKTGASDVVEYWLSRQKNLPVMKLSDKLKLPLENLYRTPETLGADRLAGSVAASSYYPQHPVLKIDFGTCITFDVVNASAQYLGGAISPGMMMRFKALHNYTSKLPLIDPMQFTQYDLTGTDTASSILSGVVNGVVHEVEGIINDYSQRFDNLKVVATGGDAGLFVTLLKSEIFARPYLVLEGLNRILNYNIKGESKS
ncbi:MAG: type III pantothenate kinase [Chitinophagales bacterium]